MFRKNFVCVVILFLTVLTACGNENELPSTEQGFEDAPSPDESDIGPFAACTKPTAKQVALINEGNLKKSEFLKRCAQATSNSPWCDQLVRPNPDSISVFRCTYGEKQIHQLIHPDQNTWNYAFGAVKLIQELEQKGFRIKLIYNWWRPEPYNKNVGGAPGRHPFATAVDVRFITNAQADQAFLELCKYRKQGKVRALGHYGTNALHFGVGDSAGNTWGKSCP